MQHRYVDHQGGLKVTYVFVGGSQRSGTSITQQLLCQLPDANPYVYEVSYLRLLASNYREGRTGFVQNFSAYFGDLQSFRDFNSGVVHAFLEHARNQLGGAAHLILKEPHLTLYWPFLFELVPEAWYLMVVRDPRDAIASMVRVGEKQKVLGQHYLFVERDIAAMCRHFLSFYEPSFSSSDDRFKQRLGVIHYEELMTDPLRMLRDISKYTGLPFDQIDPSIPPDPGLYRKDDGENGNMFLPWVTDVTGAKVTRSRIGNYRDVLTSAEVDIVERECSEFIDWFGYHRKAA